MSFKTSATLHNQKSKEIEKKGENFYKRENTIEQSKIKRVL
jgi:hypothetical protein